MYSVGIQLRIPCSSELSDARRPSRPFGLARLAKQGHPAVAEERSREPRVPGHVVGRHRVAGTGVLFTLAAGLSRGSRASVVAAFGCTIGIVPHMAAAIMGLAALLHTSALAFQVFKYLG